MTRGIGKERDDTVIDFGCRGGDPMGQVSGIRAQGFRKVLSSTMKIILARDLILVNFSGCHSGINLIWFLTNHILKIRNE